MSPFVVCNCKKYPSANSLTFDIKVMNYVCKAILIKTGQHIVDAEEEKDMWKDIPPWHRPRSKPS